MTFYGNRMGMPKFVIDSQKGIYGGSYNHTVSVPESCSVGFRVVRELRPTEIRAKNLKNEFFDHLKKKLNL